MLMKDCVEENLKPCPFCGGEAVKDFARFDYNYFGVHCTVCDAYIHDFDSEEMAVEKWNKRADEE